MDKKATHEQQRREFKMITAGGGGQVIELCHGIIIEQCNAGCSTYRVQKVHRYLKTECDTASGSGSGV